MRFDPKTHNRRSIRLKGYDYSSAGAYFVTICTQNKRCLFGDIVNGDMVLNHAGRIVRDTWLWMGARYDHVELNEYIIMPNHLHGIIILLPPCKGGSRTAPTEKRKPLGRLIGAFKTVSTKQINQIHNRPGRKLWQRNYYEHIIRNEKELNKIRKYITGNPARWEFDRENPDFVKTAD